MFSDAGSISGQLDTLAGVLPGGAIEVIGGQLKMLTDQGPAKLGFGFGEGNFKALFESIEEDQIRRGVLTA